MEFSDSVIAVLDALCDKIGIVVDWTGANVLPYVQILLERCVAYELWTSILWIVCWLILLAAVWMPYKNQRWYQALPEESCLVISKQEVESIFFWVRLIGTPFIVALMLIQLHDVIACLVFPEKILLGMARPYFK